MTFDEFLAWRADMIDTFAAEMPELLPWLLRRLRRLQVSLVDHGGLAVFAPLLLVDAHQLRARQVLTDAPAPVQPLHQLTPRMPNGPSFVAPVCRERQAA